MISEGRIAAALTLVRTTPNAFRIGFEAWLFENWALYRAFEIEATKVAAAGRGHYSANTIIEYLRHQTLLRDASGEFKFNDKWGSSLSRLFAMMNPNHATLFEYRVRRDGVIATSPEQRP